MSDPETGVPKSAAEEVRLEEAGRPLSEVLGERVESDRVRQRRAELGAGVGEDAPTFGLALSGGGIRSATFALGALQGFSHARAPDVVGEPETNAKFSLLARFDYLSTVSGGGYIGTFFGSLFVPRRLWERSRSAVEPVTDSEETARQSAADDAYRVFQHEPPQRIRSSEKELSREDVRRSALAWLRENGRYLTPSGAGDLTYATALAIRNWFSIQYVIGTVIAAAFAGVLLARFAASLWPTYAQLEQCLLIAALSPSDVASPHACGTLDGTLWWSPLFVLPVLVLLVRLVPLSIAYWLTHPGRGENDLAKPELFSAAAKAALAIVAACAVIATAEAAYGERGSRMYLVPIAAGLLALLGFFWHMGTRPFARNISQHRVVMTRSLASGLLVFVALLLIAVVDTASQTLYLFWTRAPSISTLTPAAITGAAVWAFRALARVADRDAMPGFFAKLPLGVIAGIAGVLLFFLIATLWGLLFHALLWTGRVPAVTDFAAPGRHALVLAVCFVAAITLAVVSGRFSGFLNLSSLQTLYSARLTRAYLGGSNGNRYKPVKSDDDRKRLSAAEPVAEDQIERAEYFRTLAPLHIINVTVNQTVDPAEQLVQRDRKGRPMAILPSGFSIDRMHYSFRDGTDEDISNGRGSQKLTIGQWIGTSGAAFTTGLGRSTSLGTSIALGLANVRLGTWWSSGHGKDESIRFERRFKQVFKTQTFLFYELMAKFHGLRREWQYLSDGGHFENTALYELLRPGRKVEFIVVCDDGCDAAYEFADLANLIRLARIDFDLEIEVDRGVLADEAGLSTVFGVPSEFAPGAAVRGANDKCALLLNVYEARGDGKRGALQSRIVLLKPRLIAAAPIDVHEYAATSKEFPQEPTTDQFFDQAQWESYRRLGLAIARRVFGDSDGDVGEALRKYLAPKHGTGSA